MAQFAKGTSIPVSKTKASAKRNEISVERQRSMTGTLKLVVMILLVFGVAVAMVNQYTKIVKVSTEINALEQEIKEAQQLIDTLEGRIINTANWDEIEHIARTELNMVSPGEASYTVIELHELPDAVKDQVASDVQTGEEEKSRFSLMIEELFGN